MSDVVVSHLVVSREPFWVVCHGTCVSVDDVVNIGRILGVVKD